MSAILEALRDKPLGLFQMDDDSPFQDYSGYNRTATASGTPTKHVPLADGAVYSQVFNNTTIASFQNDVYLQGREDFHFSLVASVRPILKAAPGPQKILSTTGGYDGLTVDGTVVSFSTRYLTSGEAKCSYDLQQLRNIHVAGVHTSDKNSLYVDGTLVAEVSITEAQKADSYAATSNTLVTGPSTTTNAIAVNNIGIYGTALPPNSIRRQHARAKYFVSDESVPRMFSGVRLPLGYDSRDVFLQETWDTAQDWNLAVLRGVVVENDRLVPQLVNGVSIKGDWMDSYVLSSAGATSIYGVNMIWDGIGATVQASLDGVTWETVTRGKNLSIIPPGFDPTNKVLMVKVSFPGGISDDSSFVDNLTITGLKTGIVPAVEGRTITLTSPAYARRDFEAMELRDGWGVALEGGSITISASNEPDPVNPRVVELWIKRTASSSFTTNLTSPQAYVRGQAVTYDAATPVGEWSLVHIAVPAAHTGDIVISGNAEIGQVVLYADALTTAQMQEIERLYLGRPAMRVGDNSIISVAEPPNAAQVYGYDWSISSAG